MQITPLGRQGMEDPIWGVPLSLGKGSKGAGGIRN